MRYLMIKEGKVLNCIEADEGLTEWLGCELVPHKEGQPGDLWDGKELTRGIDPQLPIKDKIVKIQEIKRLLDDLGV